MHECLPHELPHNGVMNLVPLKKTGLNSLLPCGKLDSGTENGSQVFPGQLDRIIFIACFLDNSLNISD